MGLAARFGIIQNVVHAAVFTKNGTRTSFKPTWEAGMLLILYSNDRGGLQGFGTVSKHLLLLLLLNMLIFTATFVLPMMPESTEFLPDIICDRMWHLILHVCLSVCVRAADASASYVYLDKVFRLGVWDGSNLPRTDLRLVQFLDTCIFNLLQIGHRPLLHPRATAWSFYYVWPSSMFKKKEKEYNKCANNKENRSRMHSVTWWTATVSELHGGKGRWARGEEKKRLPSFGSTHHRRAQGVFLFSEVFAVN